MSVKASAKTWTLNFLGDFLLFLLLKFSFLLPLLQLCCSSKFSEIISRNSSMPSSTSPKLKFSMSTTALLHFVTFPPWQNLSRYGGSSWVFSSQCHTHISSWHHPKSKLGSWFHHICCNIPEWYQCLLSGSSTWRNNLAKDFLR